jgi:hypothetical protein
MDITNLKPGEIALLAGIATVLSATIAGTFALVTAGINAWNARKVEHIKASREYRTAVIRPVLDRLGKAISSYHELVALGKHTDPREVESFIRNFPHLGNTSFTLASSRALITCAMVYAALEVHLMEMVDEPAPQSDGGTKERDERILEGGEQLFIIAVILTRLSLDFMLSGKTYSTRVFWREIDYHVKHLKHVFIRMNVTQINRFARSGGA